MPPRPTHRPHQPAYRPLDITANCRITVNVALAQHPVAFRLPTVEKPGNYKEQKNIIRHPTGYCATTMSSNYSYTSVREIY